MIATDAIALQEKIIGNKDSILQILESLGYKNIKDHGNYFTFPRLDGDNQSANVIYNDTLKWKCYTRNESGNLFTLIMFTKDYSFPNSLKYCAQILGIKQQLTKPKYPFSGFYKKLPKEQDSDYSLFVYSEDILKQYDGVSQKFFLEGVGFDIQEKYEITFSHEDNAIVIPIRDINGSLVGIKMRNNDNDCPHEKRFWSAYPYSKTKILYGLYNNYENIIKKDTVVIFESEKAVLQAASCGCYNAIGIGGHDLSKSQIKLIRSLMVSKIIIAFDEGLDEYEITDQCEKLVSNNTIYKPNIFYIYDKNNEILKLDSKDSPIDNGKIVFKKLLQNKLYKYKKENYD